MPGGRPKGGSARAKHSGEARKLGARARGGGGEHLDAERALVLKDYATRARQQTDATLYGTVHCALLDYFTTFALQVYFEDVNIGEAPLTLSQQREFVVDIVKGYFVDAPSIHCPEISMERVVAHTRDVFFSLRKAAARRSAP
jgi:hypothetical protein